MPVLPFGHCQVLRSMQVMTLPAPHGWPPGEGATPVQSTRGRRTLGVGFAEMSLLEPRTKSPEKREVSLTISDYSFLDVEECLIDAFDLIKIFCIVRMMKVPSR